MHSAPLKVKYHLWQHAFLHLSRSEPLKRTLRALSVRSLVNVQSCNKAFEHFKQPTYPHCSEKCQSLYQHAYRHFAQVDPIIQRVPGALLVVGSPGLLKDLINAFTFLTFEPITARDARCPGDAVGPRVTVSAGCAYWPLHATSILENREEAEVVKAEHEKKAHNIYFVTSGLIVI